MSRLEIVQMPMLPARTGERALRSKPALVSTVVGMG
jgi:hypothetical protein